VGEIKEVCQERRLGEEEVVFERAEPRDELLVLQQELEECSIGIRVSIFYALIESTRWCQE